MNGVPQVDGAEAIELREQGAVWIDVREPVEWTDVRIAGTTLVPMQQSPSWVAEHVADRSKVIVVGCRTGARSASVVAYLRDLGYVNAVNLRGGIVAWMRDGRPVERG